MQELHLLSYMKSATLDFVQFTQKELWSNALLMPIIIKIIQLAQFTNHTTNLVKWRVNETFPTN
jgi:hypothetical protein